MRVRISTTVDAAQRAAARQRAGLPDSRLIDRALAALLDQLDAEMELAAIERDPYHGDDELDWAAPPVPSLPYDGDVPADVLAAVAARRAARR